MIASHLHHLRPAYDLIVVGGGPGGLDAALAAQAAGIEHILIVDRECEPGGILLQCVHSGFGLHRFQEELTGPEYAQRLLYQIIDMSIDILCDAYVLDVAGASGAANSAHQLCPPPELRVKVMSGGHGVHVLETRAVVLAMGARERTRGAIRIPGLRPAGVLTAGLAQKLVNLMGYLPGRRVAILGSGDIGLIMARRLTLEGVEVAGVFEIMPHANGLSRNIVQCLHDFDIPLHLSTTVVDIQGRDRVNRVIVAPVDEQLQPKLDQAWDVACDTLLLSIGLVPDNELAHRLRLRMDPVSGGPVVTSSMETSRNGVFACGNTVHIHDLVDFVSQEAALAGRYAAHYVTGYQPPADNVRLAPGENVAYCVPQSLASEREQVVYLRVRRPLQQCSLRLATPGGEFIYEKKLRYVFPAEMVTLTVRPRILEYFHGDALRVDVAPR
jgi:NADPH-dependent 2,4-dienoyl-CoA reductase/sulfur reductase-like enzyme